LVRLGRDPVPSDSAEVHNLGDIIRDERTSDPSAREEAYDQVQRLRTLLCSRAVLSEREEVILTRRFGIGTDRTERFHDIGKDLDLTAERVRQLHNDAIVKLRRQLNEDLDIARHYYQLRATQILPANGLRVRLSNETRGKVRIWKIIGRGD
jgi:DNA-directed RNA polymerase sigma subunit (sigma70/sigma32)